MKTLFFLALTSLTFSQFALAESFCASLEPTSEQISLELCADIDRFDGSVSLSGVRSVINWRNDGNPFQQISHIVSRENKITKFKAIKTAKKICNIFGFPSNKTRFGEQQKTWTASIYHLDERRTSAPGFFPLQTYESISCIQ